MAFLLERLADSFGTVQFAAKERRWSDDATVAVVISPFAEWRLARGADRRASVEMDTRNEVTDVALTAAA